MTLIDRLARLLRADFHAVLDRIEEPEVLLRQAIREMEDELGREAQRLRLAEREQAESEAGEQRLADRLRGIDDELDLCLSSGEESLARGLVRRKLETEQLKQRLVERREALDETLAGQRLVFEEHRMALDGLRQKAELVALRAPSNREDGHWAAADSRVSDDEIEIALLKEKQARRLP